MKSKLIALAVLATLSGHAFSQPDSWAMPGGNREGTALYDPAKGPLPADRRYVMTREGLEAARYEAQYPQAVAQAQPAVQAAVQPAPQRNYYNVPQPQPRTVVQAPAWFVNLPEDTAEVMFAAGTGSSTDEQMAYDKARMAAERKLVEIMGAQVRSLTKSYRNDQGDTLIERFEQTVQKSANGTLIGAQRVDSQVTFDGRQYKVYVLIRYPLGETNILRREKEAAKVRQEADLRAARAHQELEQKDQAQKQDQQVDEARQREQIGPKPESAPVSKVSPVSVPTSEGEVKLLDVDNAEYRQKRSEALEKPGAVIGQTTVR